MTAAIPAYPEWPCPYCGLPDVAAFKRLEDRIRALEAELHRLRESWTAFAMATGAALKERDALQARVAELEKVIDALQARLAELFHEIQECGPACHPSSYRYPEGGGRESGVRKQDPEKRVERSPAAANPAAQEHTTVHEDGNVCDRSCERDDVRECEG